MAADADSVLIRRFVSGEQGAFDGLYHRYVDQVWRYAYARTRCRDAASEIVQDVFLRAVRALPKFHRRSKFSTWLFAIMRAATADHFSRRSRDRRVTEDQAVTFRIVRDEAVEQPPAADHDITGPPAGVSQEQQQALLSSVNGLSDGQRDVLVLCDIVGMSMREAGEVLGWKTSRVKVTLFRARRELRDAMTERDTDSRSERKSS